MYPNTSFLPITPNSLGLMRAEVDAFPMIGALESALTGRVGTIEGDTGSYSWVSPSLGRILRRSLSLSGGKYAHFSNLTNEIRAANAMAFGVVVNIPDLGATGEDMRVLCASEYARIDFYVSQDGKLGLVLAPISGSPITIESSAGAVREGEYIPIGFSYDGENVRLFCGDFIVATGAVTGGYTLSDLVANSAFNLGEYRDTVLGTYYLEGEVACPRFWARSMNRAQWTNYSIDPYCGLPSFF